MSRIASDILVSAIIRLAQTLGGSGTVDRRGSSMSGAVFITFYNNTTRTYDLYEPLSQSMVPDDAEAKNTRFFTLKLCDQDRISLADQLQKEARFDPDFWVVDLEGVTIDQLSEVIPVL